ncbi:MAG: hypothetical protein E7612_00440 [Ruminococcaceae bacterium]|nr:hypothetical protein [Oscillospiraceae bacterium]
MFGYVKPVVTELLVKEYEFYRATYCGICRSMKKHTGMLSNLTLSYDSVLLALVRMLYITDEKISASKKRCVAHPLKKRPMLDINDATEYTARAFAVLAYHKALDDIADEGVGKRILVGAARPMLSHGAAKAKIPDISEIIRKKLGEIGELEKSETVSVDAPAELFGELLGEVFAYGLSEKDATVCREFGRSLGRFIYAADAAEDYEEDRRTGKYNPYVLLYGGESLTPENKQSIKCALILECKRMESAVDLMPFGTRRTIENIVRNIIYLGLPKRIGFLDGEQQIK